MCLATPAYDVYDGLVLETGAASHENGDSRVPRLSITARNRFGSDVLHLEIVRVNEVVTSCIEAERFRPVQLINPTPRARKTLIRAYFDNMRSHLLVLSF